MNSEDIEHMTNKDIRYKQDIRTITSGDFVTASNIGNFENEATKRLSDIVESMLEEYKWENMDVEFSNKKEREDRIIKDHLCDDDGYILNENGEGIKDIGEILLKIHDKKEEINESKRLIQDAIGNYSNVLVAEDPPVKRGKPIEPSGPSNREKLQKTLFAVFILSDNFGIDLKTNDIVIENYGGPKSSSALDYYRITIEPLHKIIYTCDSNQDRTFIFDTKKLTEMGKTKKDLDGKRKSELREMIQANPGLGDHFVYSEQSFKKRMIDELSRDN